MKHCEWCQKELRHRFKEGKKAFEKRRYCDVTCVNARRREDADYRRAERIAYGKPQSQDRRFLSNRATNVKLNTEKVRAIRELHDPLGFNAVEIAAHIGVSVNAIRKILTGETWRGVA